MSIMQSEIKKLAVLIIAAISSVWLMPSAIAIDKCIEAPRRATPCEHQIYKMMKLDKTKPAKITCICLSDFKKFLTEPKNEVERKLRKMELKSLAAELQLTQEQVKNLAKR